MQKPQIQLLSIWITFQSIACGTNIDTGDNSRKHQEKVNRSAEEKAKDDDNGYEGAGSCFGKVEKLPKTLDTFCNDTSKQDRKTFSRIYKTICEEKRLANLVLPECGWDGLGDDTSRAKYLKVLDHTKIDDPSMSFYYYSAYSLTLPKNPKSFKDTIFYAHLKPNEFDKEYGLPKSTTIVPSKKGIVEKGREQSLEYMLEVESTHGPSSFNSEMRGYTIGDETDDNTKDDIDVVWDIASSGKRITMRRHLTIAFRMADGRNKILIIEEREVDDQNAHKLARTVMKQFDLRRMEMYYDYAQIK